MHMLNKIEFARYINSDWIEVDKWKSTFNYAFNLSSFLVIKETMGGYFINNKNRVYYNYW